MIDIRSPALVDSPFYNMKDSMTFPVVVFSHGLHGFRSKSSGICCDLASHGYIVAAIEHKDRSACLTFNRIPGHGVTEGDYDRYINEWLPEVTGSVLDFPFRNDQVIDPFFH